MKSQPKASHDVSAVLWAAVRTVVVWWIVNRLLVRVPLKWRIVGGFGLALVLVLVFRAPEWAFPVFVATLGLVTAGVRHGNPSGARGVIVGWDKTVAENPTLQRVLRGSRARLESETRSGFAVALRLSHGHTLREVEGIRDNLESMFGTPAGGLAIAGDPTAANLVTIAGGDQRRKSAPVDQRFAIEDPGPDAKRDLVVRRPADLEDQVHEGASRARAHAHNARARATGKLPPAARKLAWRAGEAARQAELRRRAKLERQSGQRRRGGHR